MTPQLEQQLLQQAQAGDVAAFERLQAELERPLRRFIRRLIGPSPAEDDIVQNAFVALYFHLDRIKPDGNFRPYIFRIVRNCCYDELRQQGRFARYEAVSLDGDEEEKWLSFADLTEADPPPEELTHWMLLYMQVREAIERLPEIQRETLILYVEENLSYAEIALAMSTSIGTVKSRLHHAKRTLYRMLPSQTLQALKADLQRGDDS